jgi:hypothetical protein
VADETYKPKLESTFIDVAILFERGTGVLICGDDASQELAGCVHQFHLCVASAFGLAFGVATSLLECFKWGFGGQIFEFAKEGAPV